MWSTTVVKFLFGIFALSSGMAWSMIGGALVEFSERGLPKFDAMWSVIGYITMGGGFLSILLGVTVLYYLAKDFYQDASYRFQNRNYDEE